MKNQTLDLKNYGLAQISKNEQFNYYGGGLFDFYDKVGYWTGFVIGITLKVTEGIARDLLIGAAKK